MRVDKISINLHCGHSEKIVNEQIQILSPLEKDYDIDWNLRIKRYPKAYKSYSLMMNHAVATSKHEWMLFVNDRSIITLDEAKKMIDLVENGFSVAMLYNVGYMLYSKEVHRQIGFWDEGFIGGGWEDVDFVYRLKEADLAIYESQESNYNYGEAKSPLQDINSKCRYSTPRWEEKWDNKYGDAIIRMMPEPKYEHWELFLGEENTSIRDSWKKWDDSILNINYNRPGSGPSGSSRINGRRIVKYEDVKHLTMR